LDKLEGSLRTLVCQLRGIVTEAERLRR